MEKARGKEGMWIEVILLITVNSREGRNSNSVVRGILSINLHSFWLISRSIFSKNYWDNIWAFVAKISLYHPFGVCPFNFSKSNIVLCFFFFVVLTSWANCAQAAGLPSSEAPHLWGGSLQSVCEYTRRFREKRCHPQVDNLNQEPQLTSFTLNNITATCETAQWHMMFPGYLHILLRNGL